MTKKSANKTALYVLCFTVLVVLAGAIFFTRFFNSTVMPSLTKPSEESFKAPGKDWSSEKKVEDYFMEYLRMTPEEAKEARSTERGNDGKVMLRLREGTTVDALTSNLEFYGLVRDQNALKYALEHSEDQLVGKNNALKVGENTIDIWAFYRISEDMSAWEIADQLLNHPNYFAFDEYNYMFMP